MYFYLKNGKQHLDMQGDFVISHNNVLVKARIGSAAPRFVHNVNQVLNVSKLTFINKLITTIRIIMFVWGADKALTPQMTRKNNPVRK